MTTDYELVNRTTGQVVTDRARLYNRWWQRAIGLMLRQNVADDAAYIFEYDDIERRGVHMILVFCALDVVWLKDGEVHQKATLQAHYGHAAHPGDAFIEFPAGGADGIRVGDTLVWGPR